jgi:hypothetical protein
MRKDLWVLNFISCLMSVKLTLLTNAPLPTIFPPLPAELSKYVNSFKIMNFPKPPSITTNLVPKTNLTPRTNLASGTNLVSATNSSQSSQYKLCNCKECVRFVKKSGRHILYCCKSCKSRQNNLSKTKARFFELFF